MDPDSSYCTVDFDTIEQDQKVTIRNRDDMTQQRVDIDRIGDVIRDGLKDWKPN
jgi:glycyl-tRNA synthetase